MVCHVLDCVYTCILVNINSFTVYFKTFLPQALQSASQTQTRNNMGLRITGDNLVQWHFDNVEINYLNLSLTCILKLNFVAYVLRGKFETMPSLPKTTEKLNTV